MKIGSDVLISLRCELANAFRYAETKCVGHVAGDSVVANRSVVR